MAVSSRLVSSLSQVLLLLGSACEAGSEGSGSASVEASSEDGAPEPRVASEPNFADPAQWTYLGVAAESSLPPPTFPTTPDVGVPVDGTDPVDPISVVTKHRAIVIRDSDRAIYRKVALSPSAPMDRSVGVTASAILAGTQGLALQDTAGDGPPSLAQSPDEPPIPPEGCDAEAGVACTVFSGDGRSLRPTTTSYPWRTMVGLYLKDGGGPSFCSGVFIGPRHVLTAAHCIWDRSANTLTKVKVVPGLDGFATEPNGMNAVKFYVVPDGWDEEGSTRYDYALLVLWDQELSLGWQGFAAKSHPSLNESSAWLVGYPANHWECSASPEASGLCWDHLYAQSCTLQQVWASEIWHKCDAKRGQSGSPHYHYNGGSRQVVGVLSAESSNWNKDCRIRSGNFDSLCDWIGDYPTEAHDHDCY